ncbi:MAG: 23S rRNA (guanosine(2251)-2'-O)-methyltransferase RlmB [Defluviitaleaceae bacterium]|nr:23S rRNA (guanosine(2251)-2'-O)-methyltransferase RlmB [Defluviitaleaceae bacterium]
MKKNNETDHINEDAPFTFEGRNAVLEAFAAGKTIHRLLVKKGEIEGSLRVIVAQAKELGVPVMLVPKEKLDAMSENGKHQGVIAFAPAYEYADLDTVLTNITQTNQQPFLIILDKIYDPHNLGAIIRTASAAGAHAVIIPKRRSAGITSAVVRASAGAVEHIPICRVANISQTIDRLKKQNIWIVGTDAAGQLIYNTPLTGALALVIGNEGEGISRLVREKCDFLASIPMLGPTPSLNASVAAAVAMYEVLRRKF